MSSEKHMGLFLSFKSLKSLHLRHSSLSLTPALIQLQVGSDNFSILLYPHHLQVKLLRMLNLSHLGFTEVNLVLSVSLEELDLSNTSLEVFSKPTTQLYFTENCLIPHLLWITRLISRSLRWAVTSSSS